MAKSSFPLAAAQIQQQSAHSKDFSVQKLPYRAIVFIKSGFWTITCKSRATCFSNSIDIILFANVFVVPLLNVLYSYLPQSLCSAVLALARVK